MIHAEYVSREITEDLVSTSWLYINYLGNLSKPVDQLEAKISILVVPRVRINSQNVDGIANKTARIISATSLKNEVVSFYPFKKNLLSFP